MKIYRLSQLRAAGDDSFYFSVRNAPRESSRANDITPRAADGNRTIAQLIASSSRSKCSLSVEAVKGQLG